MIDPLRTQPDIDGPSGRAWRFRGALAGGCLASWVLWCPQAHPAWSWWELSVLVRSAVHELVIIAFDPAAPMPPDLGDARLWRFLTPADVVEQLVVGRDDHARCIARAAAWACVAGRLLPDPVHRSAWALAITSTAECLRAGMHEAARI